MSESLLRIALLARTRLSADDPERGDVPGWVMITIMTAGIVTVIWGFADDALKDLFQKALTDVQTPRG